MQFMGELMVVSIGSQLAEFDRLPRAGFQHRAARSHERDQFFSHLAGSAFALSRTIDVERGAAAIRRNVT